MAACIHCLTDTTTQKCGRSDANTNKLPHDSAAYLQQQHFRSALEFWAFWTASSAIGSAAEGLRDATCVFVILPFLLLVLLPRAAFLSKLQPHLEPQSNPTQR